jgi:hypothetical protein
MAATVRPLSTSAVAVFFTVTKRPVGVRVRENRHEKRLVIEQNKTATSDHAVHVIYKCTDSQRYNILNAQI